MLRRSGPRVPARAARLVVGGTLLVAAVLGGVRIEARDAGARSRLVAAAQGLSAATGRISTAPELVSGGANRAGAALPGRRSAALGSHDAAGPRTYSSTTRQVTAAPPINVAEAARREAASPPPPLPEITEVEPPQGRPGLRSAVPIVKAPSAPPPSATGPSPGPTETFKGEFLSGTTIPPDTMGAVGTTHVVNVTNDRMRIQTRDGVELSRVTLTSFWAGATVKGAAVTSAFDPKVYYDRFNNRFILVSSLNGPGINSGAGLAVSQTADPTGLWNRFTVIADPASTAAAGHAIDYPSVGFNSNWIVVDENTFNYSGTAFTSYYGQQIFVFDKAAAYANTLGSVSLFEGTFATCAASATQAVELGCGFTMAPSVNEDNATTTDYLVEDWDSTAAQLRLSKLTGTPAAPVLTVATQFPQSPNSWRFNAARIGTTGGYTPQKQQSAYLTSGTRIMANDSRIQNAVLRNGSLWTTHHVMLAATATPAGTTVGGTTNPDTHSGIQWWKIDPTVETGLAVSPLDRGRIEDPSADNCHDGAAGTRTTGACTSTATQHGTFFAFPNISVNLNNDVLIGFTQFSALTYPNSAYAMRLAADPLGSMRDPVVFRPGQANYNIGAGTGGTTARQNRWGDYSSAQTDPANDTDFWTVQEYAGTVRDFGIGLAGNWETWWALVKPGTAPPSKSGTLKISEFRLRGPQGVRDEFVELYNPSDTPAIVNTTDNSDGWALAAATSAGATSGVAVVPNGTVIPARGHFLFADNPDGATGLTLVYSLNTYPAIQVRSADSDTGWSFDLPDNDSLALFKSADTAGFTAPNRLDAAGPVGATFLEGTGYGALPASSLEYTMFRKLISGTPQDTDDNAADFQFADTAATSTTAGQSLGAPGPENLDGPRATSGLLFAFLDPSVTDATAPNRVRDTTPGTDPPKKFGTVSYRRRVTNNTGSPITRLRFRIVDVTTTPNLPGATADLRAITSVDVIVGATTVRGTTVEQPPAQATNGGGFNTSDRADIVTLAVPLAPGASLPVQFLFGNQNNGTVEKVKLCAEAYPAGGGCFTYDSQKPTAVTIAAMSAVRAPRGVVVRWRTGADASLLGFNVYRGPEKARVTRRLVLAHTGVAGARYSFVDARAPRGGALRYWIKAVRLSGTTSWYGPVAVR